MRIIKVEKVLRDWEQAGWHSQTQMQYRQMVELETQRYIPIIRDACESAVRANPEYQISKER